MANTNNKYEKYFTASGCLSQKAMQLLYENKIDEKDRKIIEAHIKECKLCRAAYEGIKKARNAKNIKTGLSNVHYRYYTRQFERKRPREVLNPDYMKFIGVVFLFAVLIIMMLVMRKMLV